MATLTTHGSCGKTWMQRGNKTGHCSGCHETFEGISLFDAHQRHRDPRGIPTCLDPATMDYPKGWPLARDEYGTWRTTKPWDGPTSTPPL